jgi:hypothetical protein
VRGWVGVEKRVLTKMAEFLCVQEFEEKQFKIIRAACLDWV